MAEVALLQYYSKAPRMSKMCLMLCNEHESAETEAVPNLVKKEIREVGFRIWKDDFQDEKRSG